VNPRTDTFIISRYGWSLLFPFGALVLILLLSLGFTFFTFMLLVAFAFLLYVHRNPERISNYAQNGSILAPIDGRVVKIASVDHSPIDGKPGFEVIIESGYADVSILRSPMNAVMHIDKIQHGAMTSLKSSHKNLNETADIRFSSSFGEVLVRHLLASWARPLRFGAEGEVIENQRYGLMIRGITTVYLPSNSRVAIKEGMFLSAGESVIGFFSAAA
jgi:hypothetical protein